MRRVVKRFLQKAINNKRISEHAASSDTLTLLKNLELLNDKGEFLLAALLLFGKRPKKYAPAEQALREAILNSIIHKDYNSTTIFLRIYDSQLEIWNPGKLPDSLTVDQLKSMHNSIPRNRLIADVFFMAGYIEAWGRSAGQSFVIYETVRKYHEYQISGIVRCF
jgi:predicted HTH transcriptional regulator